jgi:large subunit ribosomal protein L23
MDAYDVLIRPIITEKSVKLAQDKAYTFKVSKNANKYQIKDAVEKVFDVKVAKVNTMNISGKPKRQGRTQGRTSSWKKAIVTVTQNSNSIKIFEL